MESISVYKVGHSYYECEQDAQEAQAKEDLCILWHQKCFVPAWDNDEDEGNDLKNLFTTRPLKDPIQLWGELLKAMGLTWVQALQIARSSEKGDQLTTRFELHDALHTEITESSQLFLQSFGLLTSDRISISRQDLLRLLSEFGEEQFNNGRAYPEAMDS